MCELEVPHVMRVESPGERRRGARSIVEVVVRRLGEERGGGCLALG